MKNVGRRARSLLRIDILHFAFCILQFLSRRHGFVLFASSLLALTAGNVVVADDELHRITFVGEDKQVRTVQGKILVEAADGGILVLGRDGRLWNVRENLKGLYWVLGPKGLVPSLMPWFFDYLRPSFHPWGVDDTEVLARWRDHGEQYMVTSEEVLAAGPSAA